MECEKCSNRYLCERGDSGKNSRSLQPNISFYTVSSSVIPSPQREKERDSIYALRVCVFALQSDSSLFCVGIGMCGTYCVLLLGNVEEIFIQWLEIERIVIFDDDQNRLLFCRIA